jgi:hypothetical protein
MRGQPFRFADFGGGVDSKSAPYLLEPNRARDARNVVSSNTGALRKRDGCSLFATAGVALTGLAPFEATANKFLIGAGGTVVYSISPGGTVTTIKTGMTNGARWDWVQAAANGGQGPLYGMNGTDKQQWDGVAATTSAWTATSGAVPAGTFLKSLGNRVWVAGDPANPSRLYWSDIGNPRGWTAANVLDLDPQDGDQITGLGTAGNVLLVFKRRKVFEVYGLDDGSNRRVSDNIGCVAHRSIVETPAGTFFLTLDKGVWSYDGSSLKRMSEQLTPTIQGIVPGNAPLAAGAYFNDHYYLSVSTSGSANDLTLDYDFQLGSWWLHDNAEAQWAVFTGSSTPELYGAKGTSVRKCYSAGVTQDEGANFTSYWKGPWHVFGNEHVRKRVRQIRFDGTGTIDVYVAKDFAPGETLNKTVTFTGGGTLFGGSGSFGGAGTFGDPASVQFDRIVTPGVARAWSLRVGNSSSSSWQVDSYLCAIQPRKD